MQQDEPHTLVIFDFHDTLYKGNAKHARAFRAKLLDIWREDMEENQNLNQMVEERSIATKWSQNKKIVTVIWNLENIKDLNLYDEDILEASVLFPNAIFGIYSAAELSWFMFSLVARLFKYEINPFDPYIVRSNDIYSLVEYKSIDYTAVNRKSKTRGCLAYAKYLDIEDLSTVILVDDDSSYEEDLIQFGIRFSLAKKGFI